MTTTDDFFVKHEDTDRYGRPMLDLGDGKPVPVTRVSTLAKTLDYTGTLGDWQERMVAHGVAQRPELIALAAVTPVSDKKAYADILDKAKFVGGADVKANRGTAFHEYYAQVIKGREIIDDGSVPDLIVRAARMLSGELARLGIHILPELVERTCVTQSIKAAGTFDGIATLPNGRTVIIDYKTGNIDYQAHSTAIQTAIYAHADLLMDEYGKPTPMVPVDQETSLLIHVDLETTHVSLYELDLVAGWQAAILATKVREYRRCDDLMHPFTAGTTNALRTILEEQRDAVLLPTTVAVDTKVETQSSPFLVNGGTSTDKPALSPQAQRIVDNINTIREADKPAEPVEPAPAPNTEPSVVPDVEADELYAHLKKSKPAMQEIAQYLMSKHPAEIKLKQYGASIAGDIVRHELWPTLRESVYGIKARSTVHALQLVKEMLNSGSSPEDAALTVSKARADDDPFAALAAVTAPAVTEGELIIKIGAAQSLEDLSAIWQQATMDASIGWTGQLNTAAQIRQSELGL